MAQRTILEVDELCTHYLTQDGEVMALDDASFKLDKGESIGVAGESGCGKSTMAFSLLNQVQPPGQIMSGSIDLDGIEVTELSEKEARKKIRWNKISMVFQGAMEIMTPVYTVGHQMKEPLKYHKDITGQEARDICEEYLELVNLDGSIFDRYPHELSGGQKQRVIIATALLLEPDVVIFDEPTTALDVVVEARIMNDLKRLRRELDIAMIFITHDLSILAEISDKLAIMYAGWIVELGSADDIYTDPKHPYTEKLVAAIPDLHTDIDRLEYIPGVPPNLVEPPSGCRFHPRCHKAMEVCREKEPEVYDVGGVEVKCHLYSEDESIAEDQEATYTTAYEDETVTETVEEETMEGDVDSESDVSTIG
ncbi:MAG: ABC transporter ATP-binding protein [Candidatus Thermoplasmatota archaeon]